MKTMPHHIFGIDAALTETGLCCLRLRRLSNSTLFRISKCEMLTVTTHPESPIERRLKSIYSHVLQFLSQERVNGPVRIGIEGYARGARFRREEMGEAVGAISVACCNTFRSFTLHRPTPRQVKELVCPDWAGLSRKNWEAAGRAKSKFKRSMPTKNTVSSRLYRYYGINAWDSHTADAACVALCVARDCGLEVRRVKEQ